MSLTNVKSRVGSRSPTRICGLCDAGGDLERIQLVLGHSSVQTTERYLDVQQDLVEAPNDHLGLRWTKSGAE